MIYYRENEITVNYKSDLSNLSDDELLKIWLDKRRVWKRPNYRETIVYQIEKKRKEKKKRKTKSENQQYTLVDKYNG